MLSYLLYCFIVQQSLKWAGMNICRFSDGKQILERENHLSRALQPVSYIVEI
jgi:hypothetical protein